MSAAQRVGAASIPQQALTYREETRQPCCRWCYPSKNSSCLASDCSIYSGTNQLYSCESPSTDSPAISAIMAENLSSNPHGGLTTSMPEPVMPRSGGDFRCTSLHHTLRSGLSFTACFSVVCKPLVRMGYQTR